MLEAYGYRWFRVGRPRLPAQAQHGSGAIQRSRHHAAAACPAAEILKPMLRNQQHRPAVRFHEAASRPKLVATGVVVSRRMFGVRRICGSIHSVSSGSEIVRTTQLRRTLGRVLGVSILASVASCGGGGGGGSSNPVLATTTFTTNENVALNGNLSATDPGGGTVNFAQGSTPKSGTLSGFTPAGAFVYTPNQSFTGSDSFTVTATDSAGHSSTATINITVTVDHPPAASNTIVRNDAPGATAGAINVLANASDPDKDKLTVTLATPASVGTATVNSDGTVRISGLPGNFKGLTRFGYTVTDPSGKTASGAAAVFVGVDPVPNHVRSRFRPERQWPVRGLSH